ncbi:MAG: fucose isomerase, partial [Bryobacteraceae bacterium]|nr:fucose isomerase [Bryobacteraceae bacterium]
MAETAILIANGDLRLSANQVCWPAQREVEEKVIQAVRSLGYPIERGHPYDENRKHGFIDSQKYGMEVFRRIPPTAPLIVVEAVWQYSHHILHGLYTHQGPILTIANWSGQWPGLVGMLNLNGCMTKAGIPYSTLWSENFDDEFFLSGLKRWLEGERIVHDTRHVRPLGAFRLPADCEEMGVRMARELYRNKAIMGVFDEGCMGMYNAIVPDELLHRTGVFKERLSQSALYAEMLTVSDEEALEARRWLDAKGMKFVTGPDPETDLTDDQILQQLKMYIAAVR